MAERNAKPFGVHTAFTLYKNRPEGADDPPELAAYADIVADCA